MYFCTVESNVTAMKKISVISFLALSGILLACNKTPEPTPKAPEIEFKVHDTIEYYYDQEVKGRVVCSVDSELPVDTVWFVVSEGPLNPGQGSWDDYCLMREQDGSFVYVICPYSGLELDYCYCLSIGGWRYHSEWEQLHVHQSDLDSIMP
jgi:hypothetical protein